MKNFHHLEKWAWKSNNSVRIRDLSRGPSLDTSFFSIKPDSFTNQRRNKETIYATVNVYMPFWFDIADQNYHSSTCICHLWHVYLCQRELKSLIRQRKKRQKNCKSIWLNDERYVAANTWNLKQFRIEPKGKYQTSTACFTFSSISFESLPIYTCYWTKK